MTKSTRHMKKAGAGLRAAAKNKIESFPIIETFVAGHVHGEWDVTKRIPQGTVLDLVFEMKNPYDGRALKLMHKGLKIGYMPRVDTPNGKVGYQKVWEAINQGVRIRVTVLQHAPQNPSYYALKVRVEGHRVPFTGLTNGTDRPVPTF